MDPIGNFSPFLYRNNRSKSCLTIDGKQNRERDSSSNFLERVR